jgi:hypothetical protein
MLCFFTQILNLKAKLTTLPSIGAHKNLKDGLVIVPVNRDSYFG